MFQHDLFAGHVAVVTGGGSGLGLAGLRDRVEALGGSFETINRPEGGAEVRMVLTTVRG